MLKGMLEFMRDLKGSKGANLVIPLAIMIIFIGTFFAIFIFDMLIYDNLCCLFGNGDICTERMFITSTTGLFIIFFLIIMIIIALYIMFVTLDEERKYSYTKGLKLAKRKR